MVVFTCEHEWEAMMTCIYEAWSSGLGHKNIRLEFDNICQHSLFDEYRHIERDACKAAKVMDAINMKISRRVYFELSYCSMAYEEDVLDNIYRVLLLGFNYGPHILEMVQYKDVMRNREIRLRLGREAHSFREFLRFHEVRKGLYVAHIEPKSKIVVTLGPLFEDRMPSEHWMIVDDIHKEAVIHPKDGHFYLQILNDEELNKLKETERENDNFTDLWKLFFETIAIKERTNKRCQDNLFPVWTRKHAVEFLN